MANKEREAVELMEGDASNGAGRIKTAHPLLAGLSFIDRF